MGGARGLVLSRLPQVESSSGEPRPCRPRAGLGLSVDSCIRDAAGPASVPWVVGSSSLPLLLSHMACLPQAGDPLGDGGSTLDFMAMKPYSDVSLDISVLSCLGRLCQVPCCACC